MDIGSVSTFLLIGLAGVVRANSRRSSGHESTVTYSQHKWAACLPYAGAVAAFIMLIWSHYYSNHIGFGQMALGVGVLMGFVLLRQITVLCENTMLYRSAQAEIATRQKAEKALQESYEYMDKILNSVGDPIFVKDRLHRYILVNDAYCNFVGSSREEIIDKTGYDLFPGEQAGVFREIDEDVFNNRRENANEVKMTDIQGIVHTIITKRTLYIDKSQNESLVGIVRDITEQKTAEEALRASERKYREFTDSLPQIVYELDAQGNYIFANRSAYSSIGYTKQEFDEGLNVLQTFIPGDRERVIRNIHRLMK